MYVAAYLGAPGNKGTNDLATSLGAVRAAKDAGFDPQSVPDLKIAFITSPARRSCPRARSSSRPPSTSTCRWKR